MFGPFPIAHLLRITRDHEAVFRQVETKLTKQGYICFAPVIYDFDIYLQHKQLLKDMCYEKLLQADLCVVVTPEHIGKSTSLRIKQAKELHKPVFVWLHETLIPMEEWETTYKNK